MDKPQDIATAWANHEASHQLDDKLVSIWMSARNSVEAIPKIKQAFADEGYITPEQAKKVQELINQMTGLVHSNMVMPIIQPVAYNKRQQTIQNLMSGQEWYKRFEKELKHLVSRGDGETWMGWDCGEVREAAKKASGINE